MHDTTPTGGARATRSPQPDEPNRTNMTTAADGGDEGDDMPIDAGRDADSAQARIVAALDVDERTIKRATWERWELEVADQYQIRVTNTSYAKDEQADHEYIVTVVETADGDFLPADCDCPADKYNDADCKHKLAVALHGGPAILGAAVAYDPTTDGDGPTPDGGTRVPTATLAEKLGYGGGA